MITVLLILLPIIYYVYTTASQFYKNYQDAKNSGIPYLVAPVYGYNRFWLLTEKLWFPLINRLPSSLTEPWKHVVSGDWAWHVRYAPFAWLKTDTFIIVNPQRNIMVTADAAVINQITTRRNDFPKPVEVYQALDIFGKNVVTTEGKEWRRHRRITAPPFGEQNNRLVWKETIFQANEMLSSWTNLGEKLQLDNSKSNGHLTAEKKHSPASLVDSPSKDAMRLSLHVISRAGFDVRCLWPGLESTSTSQEGAMKSGEVPPGHVLSFVDSIQILLHRIVFLLIFPDWLIRVFPAKLVRETRTAYLEWGKYMNQIYDRNVRLITSKVSEQKLRDADAAVEGLDLMGSMITHSGLIKGTPNHGNPGAGLSQSEIMGNSFVLFLAGHETAANSIHFCILYLALRPGLQRKLQAELETIFGDRNPSKGEWNYDQDLPKLFAGLAGAIMNEELRLIPPVVGIPKSTDPGRPMPLLIDGKEFTVPGGTYIALSAGGVHRNPKYWPHGTPRTRTRLDGEVVPDPIHTISNVDNDLEEFKPERWLLDEKAIAAQNSTDDEERPADDLAVNTAPDTAATMYRPPKGAYIPFSEGFRSCVGRRFAQVEILATLAIIFRRHSIELSVDEFASEDEVAVADAVERKRFWESARRSAEQKLRDEMGTVITLQLRGEGVKVRVCPKGEEVFDYREY
jgi:cytochrome P450